MGGGAVALVRRPGVLGRLHVQRDHPFIARDLGQDARRRHARAVAVCRDAQLHQGRGTLRGRERAGEHVGIAVQQDRVGVHPERVERAQRRPGQGLHDAHLVDLRGLGPAHGPGEGRPADRVHERLAATGGELLGVPHALGQGRDGAVGDLQGEGADGDGAGEGAAPHLVQSHDDASARTAASGERDLEVEGGCGGGHGWSGTSAKASLPSPSPVQRLAGQKTASARPVMSDSSTKPLSPLISWYAESAEA